MIRLTRLDGERFILNAELIRYVEARPDTFITLTSGERLIVQETMDEVAARALTYQQSKYLIPPPGTRIATGEDLVRPDAGQANSSRRTGIGRPASRT
jgi:flagellar protein FlbD